MASYRCESKWNQIGFEPVDCWCWRQGPALTGLVKIDRGHV